MYIYLYIYIHISKRVHIPRNPTKRQEVFLEGFLLAFHWTRSSALLRLKKQGYTIEDSLDGSLFFVRRVWGYRTFKALGLTVQS